MRKEAKTRQALRPGRIKLAAVQRRITEQKVANIRDNTILRTEGIAKLRKLIAELERMLRHNASLLPWRFPAAAMPLIYQTPAPLFAEMKEYTHDTAWSVQLMCRTQAEFAKDRAAMWAAERQRLAAGKAKP